MNIAQRSLAYYDSEDFKNNYSQILYEIMGDSEQEVVDGALIYMRASRLSK